MGLSWINPLYLSGLLLLALPVLIHLVQRRQVNGIKFPSLMFLAKIPYREKRRLVIKNWLLLMLRCLLMILIVLAFARPFLNAGTDLSALELARSDSVIVIDKSYSMRVADHWQQAQEIALKLVDRKNALDRIGVVLFDDKAEVLSELTTDATILRTVIKRQMPGLKTTRLRLAIEQAARLLAVSNASQKRILLVSDFQASASSPGKVPQITRDIELTPLAVDVADTANATISSFSIGPSARAAGDEFSLKVEVTNHTKATLDQQISLEVDGRELQRRDIRLGPESAVSETFQQLSVSGDLLRGIISLNDDALAIDNRAYFVYSSKQQVPVLIVEGAQPRDNQTVYLEQALKLSHNPVFQVKRMAWSELKAEDLLNWAVIIVNDATIPGGVLGEALKNFVASGGGLLVAVGDRVQGNWPSGDEGFLPGTLLRRIDSKQGMAQRMTALDGNHPLASIDLSTARIFSYRNLLPEANDRVLGRYGDGATALLERRVGQGRVLVLTTTLDTHWNNLALQPVFLPFLHLSMRYLAAFESYPNEYEVGSVVDVMRYARALSGGDAIVAAADASALIIEPPGAGEIRLSRQSPLLNITQQGFYQVHHATPAGADVVLAANINPTEANLNKLDVAHFLEEIRASAEAPSPGTVLTRRQAEEYEEQQQLWYGILSVVLLLMLAEAISANWIVRKQSLGASVKS